MSVLSNLIYRCKLITIKFKQAVLDTDKSILKFSWKCKEPRIAKILWKRTKVGKINTAYFLKKN